jgi:tetratricopeptide (TPR) repeat protein
MVSVVKAQDPDDELDAELEELLAEERAEADSLRRHGHLKEALRLVAEHLDDDPGDWRSRAIRGRTRLDQAEYTRASTDLKAAYEAARSDAAGEALDIGLDLAGLDLLFGRTEAARARLGGLVGEAPRRDWLTGAALLEAGDRMAAREAFDTARNRPAEGDDWVDFLYRARCERALGQLEAASQSLVTADKLARGKEAEVLVELADVYLEADGEVARAGSSARQPSKLYREALELCPGNVGALLGLYHLHDLNWRRGSRSARSFLDELLGDRPGCLPAELALVEDHLKNGELKAAREGIRGLREVAPELRAVHVLAAALAAITDHPDEVAAELEALSATAPWDSAPERLCGEVLVSLYRFQDALVYLDAATARNPRDWRAWTRLGEALSNTGDEDAGLAALERAKDTAEGRQDAWRNNEMLVLAKIESRWVVTHGAGQLSYALPAVGQTVLERVLEPFYAASREELAARYGYTPGPVRIEVFDRHGDFSVRSTGFEGFPALGVCFGPVVTALSPLCEMRGSFSWAETSYHEFSHVIHLGLTHNRCPRWITEGLATWEEEQRNPSWTRNLRRELVDSVAGGGIIGVRDLNRAFRGPRIIWAYYQGKLMCDLLIDRYGFPAMVDFLEAFDRGLDLDAALDAAYSLTPEELDADFFAHVEAVVAGLHVEPRRDPVAARVLSFQLGTEPPLSEDARAEWAEGWCTVAWAAWQDGRRVDAEEALRRIKEAGLTPARAELLRGELALAAGDREAALAHYDAGFAAGGEGFRARMARASLAGGAGDREALHLNLLAAEADFPGWDEPALSAELALVQYYEEEGDEAQAMAARERWLRWNSGDVKQRLLVGNFRLERGDPGDAEAALALFTGAVEVDPFRADAHQGRGEALLVVGRFPEARDAFETALAVPPELDAEYGAGPIADGVLGAEALGKHRAAIDTRRTRLEALLEEARSKE